MAVATVQPTLRPTGSALLAVLVAASALLSSAASLAQTGYALRSNTVDGGGTVDASGGPRRLGGTTGQPDAGVLANGTYQINGGFWGGIVGATPVTPSPTATGMSSATATRTATNTPTRTPTQPVTLTATPSSAAPTASRTASSTPSATAVPAVAVFYSGSRWALRSLGPDIEDGDSWNIKRCPAPDVGG
jgi:hypothetical protein